MILQWQAAFSPVAVPATASRELPTALTVHLSRQRLEAGLGQIRDSPPDGGRILVVRRPAVGVRELPGETVLDPVAGLAGDDQP